MAWYNDKNDFWHLAGDPGGYITGQNTGGITNIPNMLSGDPKGVKQAYDDAMKQSRQMGEESRDFLLGQQAKALQFYAPLQHMFQGAYGTEGIRGPQIPQATAGVGPLARTYGGK